MKDANLVLLKVKNMLQCIPNKSHSGVFMTNPFSSLASLQHNHNWMELQFVVISENLIQ